MLEADRFLNSIVDSILDPFCVYDRDLKAVRMNEAYARLKHNTPEALTGKTCHEMVKEWEAGCRLCVVEKTLNSADPCAAERLIRRLDGQDMWLEIYTYPVRDEAGAIEYVIEYIRDITERKRAEEENLQLIERLERLSRTDSLTGLLNRRALKERLEHEMDRTRRYGAMMSVILCDIDRFKKINDRFGHSAGDSSLVYVAETIRRELRKSDILGRYGGDEFMLILPATGINGAQDFAERVRALINATPAPVPENPGVRISMSMGVAAFWPSDGMDAETIIKRADEALYASKHAGRNRVSVFQEPLFHHLQEEED